ncbi:hypothetical protein Pfo_015858 [Paulownia fortunei]|nr:hypothetical protein Pfo_015858 [Paulownia fortunei]
MALKSPQFALNNKSCFWASANGRKTSSSFSCLLPFYSQRLRLRGNSAIVAAAKKENRNINKRKKDDSHSFVPRPDEATGPFPEAVLLKERKVEEDGRLMPEFADVEERELFEALNLQLESDMDVDQMRHYEVVYLIHEDHKEEVENVNIKIQEFFKEKKGKIWRISDWGMRRLAYKIQKAKNAHYILMNFELEARWINDFKSMLDGDERIIRHLVIKRDKAETEDCPPPPEFHTLRADANDDDEDIDYSEDYDDEDWDDEGDMDNDNENEGIIYVDDDVSDRKMSSSSGRKNEAAQKVGR